MALVVLFWKVNVLFSNGLNIIVCDSNKKKRRSFLFYQPKIDWLKIYVISQFKKSLKIMLIVLHGLTYLGYTSDTFTKKYIDNPW